MKSNYDLIVELLGYANVNEDFLIDYHEEIKNIEDKMILDRKNVVLYERLHERYKGEQLIVAIEEMSELQKELCKLLRNEIRSMDNIEEEIADVSIMLEQLMIIMGITPNTLAKIREKKLHRTWSRILCENEI